MTIESAADRLESLKALGEVVTFTVMENTWTAYGVLEREFVAVGEVESYHPVLMCRVSDTTEHATYAVTHDTKVTASSVDFTIIGIQPDGTGMVTFVLEESC